MLRYLLRKSPASLLTLVLASICIFAVIHLLPGNPALILAGNNPSPGAVAAITRQLGLEQPLPVQYAKWIAGFFTGSLGNSYILGSPIATLIGAGIGPTLALTVSAMLVAILIGGAGGLLAATSRSQVVQSVVNAVTTVSITVPTYISGLVLILLLAVATSVFPPGGYASFTSSPGEFIRFIVLPAVTLALPLSGVITRYLQTALRRVLAQDYIAVARSRGVSRLSLIYRHALPNALPQLLTIVGIQVGQLFAGAVIVEAIFAWPGLGHLLVNALISRDYLLVQDLLLLTVGIFIVIQTLTDILHAALDPRLRLNS